MITSFLTIFAALFSMVNPLGAMPVYAVLTADETHHNRNATAKKASIYFVLILILFYFVGTSIMNFFGISLEAMRIAGGFVIFSSGVALMGGNIAKSRTIDKKVTQEAIQREDISLTPLAMPMLSGPGSISMLIAFNAQNTGMTSHLVTVAAVMAVGVITFFILRATPYMMKLLGTSGINSISRILGFFVMAIGVQYVINGITPLFKNLLSLYIGMP
jgi:multiple antibiotic resistance protein